MAKKFLYMTAEGYSSESADAEVLGIGKLELAGVGGVAIDAGDALISNVAAPTSDKDAANKKYVDDAASAVSTDLTTLQGTVTQLQSDLTQEITDRGTADLDFLKLDGSRTMTGALALGAHAITGVADPTNAQDAATKAYVDQAKSDAEDYADSNFLPLVGGSLSGALAMGSNKITGLGAPSDDADAATKKYVDDQDALKVSKAGDTMSGNLAMGGNKITGLAAPTDANDAVRKAYVDAMAQGIQWKQSVKYITTANIASLAAVPFDFDFDGNNAVEGDRILVNAQTTASQNGIYVAGAMDNVALTFPLTRAADSIPGPSGTMMAGDAVFVAEGTDYHDTGWVLANGSGHIDGVNHWTQFSGLGDVVAGAGLTKSGNVISAVAGNGISLDGDAISAVAKVASGLSVTGDGVQLNIAADGLQINGSNALALNISSDSLEFNSNALQAKLATNSGLSASGGLSVTSSPAVSSVMAAGPGSVALSAGVYLVGAGSVANGNADIASSMMPETARVVGVAEAGGSQASPKVVFHGECAISVFNSETFSAGDPLYLAGGSAGQASLGRVTSVRPTSGKRVIRLGYALTASSAGSPKMWVDVQDLGQAA